MLSQWLAASLLAFVGAGAAAAGPDLTAAGPDLTAAARLPLVQAASDQPPSTPAGERDPYYYFVMGRHLESQGDLDGAIKSYERAAALDPKSAEVRAELSALYARQNRAPEAADWARAALALDQENAEANRVLGLIYASRARLDDEGGRQDAEALGNATRAIGHFEAARRRAVSPDPSVEMMLGRLYLETGQREQAIVTLRRLAEQEPDRAEPTALLARAYEQAGRAEEATTLLEAAAQAHPQFYASLGELYENQRRWKDAAGAYQQALARNPRNQEVKTRLAIALLSDGGPAEAGRAAAILQEARQQSPADGHILYLLAQAQRVSGSLDDAETTAKQLAALAPSSLTGPYALAQIYDQKQQYRRIVETLQPLVEKSQPAAGDRDELARLALTLGSAYEELGEFDQALKSFARARDLAPGNDNVDAYELATLISAKRFQDAILRSEPLVAARPEDERLVRLRAEALRRVGRKADAVDLLRDALTRHPDEVSPYLALSEIYAATGEYGPAVAVLEDAAKKFPADLTLRFQLGSVFERQKRFADAERTFREVLAKDPLYAPALNYLGYMLADRGERLDESIDLIGRALRVEPYNGAYLDSLGWAYFKANRLDLAEETLRKAAGQRARDSAVQDHFGDLLFRLGRYTEAIGAWRKALDGDGEQIDRTNIDRKIRSAGEKAAKR